MFDELGYGCCKGVVEVMGEDMTLWLGFGKIDFMFYKYRIAVVELKDFFIEIAVAKIGFREQSEAGGDGVDAG